MNYMEQYCRMLQNVANTHIVSLNAECVNDEYLSEGGVLEEVIEFIRDGYF